MDIKTDKKGINKFRNAFLGELSPIKAFYEISLIIGLLLIVFEIFIYRETLISVLVPIGIILTVGITTFIFTGNHYKKTYSVKGNFFPLCQNILSWGFISCYVFMAINYYFSSSEKSKIEVKILRTGHLAKGKRGCEEPYCEVKVNGTVKQLVFPCGTNIEGSNTVFLTVRKGALGFEIFLDKELRFENVK